MEKVGLVLEGGGMRGIYTSGVLDLFMDKKLYFPYVIGVSAGACNASSYISKQKNRSRNININYIKNPKYLSLRNLIKEKSVFGFNFIFDDIPNKLEPFDYDTFNNSSQNFIIGTTNCNTGKSTYFKKSNSKDILKIIRASSSLPLLAPMVKIDGNLFLDGGIADSIPIRKSIKDGNSKNIIILTRNKEYRKSPIKFRKIIKIKYRKFPNLINTIFNRYKMYNETLDYIEELEKKGEVFIIRPSKDLKVNRLEKNKEKLNALYELGYEDTKKLYKKIENWIKE